MEQRRFILFVVLSSLVLFGWMFLGPKLFPNWFPKPPQPQNPPAAAQGEEAPQEGVAENGEAAADGTESPAEVASVEEGESAAESAPADEAAEPAAGAPRVELPQYQEKKEIVLGSLDPDSDYFIQVVATSRGAAIDTITLNGYPAETPRGVPPEQLKIVGNDPNTESKTLDLDVDRIGRILEQQGTSLSEVQWWEDEAYRRNHTDPTGVVESVQFSYPSPDDAKKDEWGLRVVRTYTIHRSANAQRDEDVAGYMVDFDLQIENLSDAPLTTVYELTGPVGLPLENVENTRTFIELKAGIAEDPADPLRVTDTDRRTASTVVKEAEAGTAEPWRAPLRFIGVDVQFFAALLIPEGNQQKDPYFEEANAVVVDENAKNKPRSDVTVAMTSRELTIPPQGNVVHKFQLFAGPKRSELLDKFGAGGVINYGWFGMISVWMVLALRFCHQVLRLPYGLAIVLLTFVVRAGMFPFTRKQARGAKKMKELQPELAKLKEKYSKEPDKIWQAQRELFRKHNYHPMAGCLPLVLQMPIFFGLYRALNMAVDLRMAPFLWIENLAAPDAMFHLPFTVPFLGWTEFNLLPFITIALWITQQKMFTPPAASEDQALQQKMMTYMMLFFGLMIYRVPAGLCVYFITSTAWGLTERKLVDVSKSDGEKKPESVSDLSGPAKAREAEAASKPPGFFQRLLEAADQARQQTNGQRQTQPSGDRKKGSGGKRKKTRR
jgi:YidC/Oxa1 family membrane protein insertase